MVERTDDVTATVSGSAPSDEESASRLRRLFAPRVFLLALVLTAAGTALGTVVPFLGPVVSLAGVAAAGFAANLVTSRRHYLETTVAGGLAGAGGVLLNVVSLPALALPVVSDYGLELVAVGVAVGALAALVGAYFGQDLRNGLTRDL